MALAMRSNIIRPTSARSLAPVFRRPVVNVAATPAKQDGKPATEKNEVRKSDLVAEIAEKTNMKKAEVEKVVDAMLEVTTAHVTKGTKVVFTGFGSFSRRERAARTGRNPQTGAELKIAASQAPAFTAGKQFKDAVKGIAPKPRAAPAPKAAATKAAPKK